MHRNRGPGGHGSGAETPAPAVAAEPPVAGEPCPWRRVSAPAAPGGALASVRPRRIAVQLLGGIAAVALLVGFLGTLAARALAEREAVNDAAMIAGVIAAAVVQPALNEALHDGDPQAVARFDRAVRDTVLGEDVVRVKLWRPDGRILYADEPQLVGRTFALSETERTALERRETHAEISDLEKSENAFETGDRLVEVYRPVSFPDGSIALFEIYLSYAPVGSRTTQLWTGFAGVTAASLLLFVLLVAPIVWHLTRRVRAAERQRTALLERAVEASTAERRRIAANLHDGPVQDLAASSFAVAGAAAAAATRGDHASRPAPGWRWPRAPGAALTGGSSSRRSTPDNDRRLTDHRCRGRRSSPGAQRNPRTVVRGPRRDRGR